MLLVVLVVLLEVEVANDHTGTEMAGGGGMGDEEEDSAIAGLNKKIGTLGVNIAEEDNSRIIRNTILGG